MFIKVKDIFILLDNLEPPIGWQGLDISFRKKRNVIGHLMIPLYNNRHSKFLHFYFYDVIKAISKLSIYVSYGIVE